MVNGFQRGLRWAGFGLLALGASGLGIYAFVSNSSPYRTIAEARHASRSAVFQLQAEVVRGSVQRTGGGLSFTLQDPGGTLRVAYTGQVPENFDRAPKVVVIGSMNDGVLVSSRMLTKCPSKYAEKNPPGAGRK
jgi:cytochrome c-type biogenesis protein CcmE